MQYGFFGDGPEYQSYTADIPFMDWQLSGYDTMRAVLSNPKAPSTRSAFMTTAPYLGQRTKGL